MMNLRHLTLKPQVKRFQEVLQSRSEIMGGTNSAQEIITYQVNIRNYNLISKYNQTLHDEIKNHLKPTGNMENARKSKSSLKQ
jgi:hypothetical protein